MFLTVAALLTLARAGGRRRALSGGLLLGLAVATKVTPILVTPAVLRRRPVTVAAAAAAATLAVYLTFPQDGRLGYGAAVAIVTVVWLTRRAKRQAGTCAARQTPPPADWHPATHAESDSAAQAKDVPYGRDQQQAAVQPRRH